MGAKMARSWTRACVVCSCRSRLAVRGSRCRPALSVGRRRDLAFGSLAPPSHREGRRAKGSRMVSEGENVRGYGSQARLKRAHKARSRRLVVGGGSCWHPQRDTELKSSGSRKGTWRWKASLFALSRFPSREGGGCRLGWRDQIHTSSDEGRNRKSMRRADRRRGSDKDARGWFASNHH